MAAKVKVSICGSSYTLSTTDPEDYITNLADRIDLDMHEILSSNASASVTSAAVTVALNYLDQLEKSTGSADNMRAQMRDYLEDAARAKMSAEDARREAAQLRSEVEKLKAKLKKAEE